MPAHLQTAAESAAEAQNSNISLNEEKSVEKVQAEEVQAEFAGEISKLNETLSQPGVIRSVALTGLFVLAIFYTLYFAREILLPITLALLLNFLLRPLIARMDKWGVRPFFGAFLVLFLFFAAIGFSFYELAHPAAHWME